MHRIVRTASSLLRLALVAAVATPAAAQFVEPEVDVIRRLDGAQDAGFFGWITANVGDLDGDGLDDLLVPAIGFDGFSGRVQVFSSADGSVLLDAVGAPGAALGYTATRAGDVDGDGVPDVVVGGGQALVLSGADGSVLLDASGLLPFVDAVAGLGDIDGDGIGDIAIGFSDAATPGAGRVQAVSGSDASVLWTVDGAGPTDGLGSALGRLDDLDGDGVDDLVAGAQNAGPANGGEAFVISGADGTVLRTLRPTRPENASSFGLFFASGTPDMTGDGVGEIYVGDLGAETEKGPATGTAHVFSGRTGKVVHALRGLSPGEGFGLGRGVEDLDGDGRGDLVIGAFSNSDGAPSAGATYVISGRSGALLRTITSTVDFFNFGGDATSLGDIDGDGRADLVATAPGLSFFEVAPGTTFVIAGEDLPCRSDLSLDGRVGLRDFRVLSRLLGDAGGRGDIDGSGEVDMRDVIALLRDWGRCPAGSLTTD